MKISMVEHYHLVVKHGTWKSIWCLNGKIMKLNVGSSNATFDSIFYFSKEKWENNWLVVWNIFYFSIYWEQSSQLTNSYFSEGWVYHQKVIDWPRVNPLPQLPYSSKAGMDFLPTAAASLAHVDGRSGICGFLWPQMRSAMPATNCWIVF